MVELAERLAALSGIPDAKVFFTTSGTEANEAALLLASTARRSNQVLALRNSYHGRSFATIGITGNRGWSASSLTPFNVHYVARRLPLPRRRSPPRRRRMPSPPRVDDLRDVIDTATAGDVACLIAEPIQGVGGFTVPPDGLFGAHARRCSTSTASSSSATRCRPGWGRTGDHFWGYEAHDVVARPADVRQGPRQRTGDGRRHRARRAVMDCTANSISTFGGNPLVSAGALANLRVPARPRPAGQRSRPGRPHPRRARAAGAASSTSSARCAAAGS